MAYGLTANGFEIKTLDEIKTSLEARMRGIFGNDIDVSPASNFGQFIGVHSDALADVWQLAQAIYASQFPNGAEGVQLEDLCEIVGVFKKPATFSEVSVQITAQVAGTLPANTVISTTTGRKIVTPNTSPISFAILETRFLNCKAVDSGPVTIPAGTATLFDVPLPNFTVTNANDQYLLGTDEESDADLRLRRGLALLALANASEAGLAAVLRQVSGVLAVSVYANESDAVDGNGLPPHSIECVVDGGNDNAIAQAIIDNKAAGIATHGTTSVSVLPSGLLSGQASTYATRFSRPTTLSVDVRVFVRVDASRFPSNGADLVKQAVVDYADQNLKIGTEVRSSAFMPNIMSVPGVLEADLPLIRVAPASYSASTILVNARQKATVSGSNVTVFVSPAVFL